MKEGAAYQAASAQQSVESRTAPTAPGLADVREPRARRVAAGAKRVRLRRSNFRRYLSCAMSSVTTSSIASRRLRRRTVFRRMARYLSVPTGLWAGVPSRHRRSHTRCSFVR